MHHVSHYELSGQRVDTGMSSEPDRGWELLPNGYLLNPSVWSGQNERTCRGHKPLKVRHTKDGICPIHLF